MGETALVTSTETETVVRATAFKKTYRSQIAVDGIDLEIHRGEIYGLIGPDGAGKSSLMKAVAGVLTFDSGSLEVFGTRVESERSAERIKHRIGLMPQGLGLNLYPELSIEENIDFFARLRLVPEHELEQRKQQLLQITRLEKFRNRPMKQLSGGMKQKLGLVCTLIHQPDLVILDEPTTGVDPVSRRDFWAILAKLLRERGITALVSTAYMDEATRFHRTSLLFGGRVLAQGEPDDILALAPGSLVTLRAQPQVQALAHLQNRFAQVEAMGPWFRVFVEQAGVDRAAEQVRDAVAGLEVVDLDVSEPELEDVFVALLRHKQLIEDSPLTKTGQSTATVQTDTDIASDNDSVNAHRHHARHDNVAIEANQLVRKFGDFTAVDRVSFQVPQGEIFGLLGANGAGKTTVIKMLTGLMPPSAGTGRVAGADMRSASQTIKERIGYMSQAFSLYQDLTVVENIRLYAAVYGLNRSATQERLRWIINMAGLGGHEGEQAGRLPMGLRQRLALGCALVHRPQILFLDEPTSGVDPVGRRRFWDILFRLAREDGVSILVTTHYMSEAEHCDHLALMYAGRIVADASPEQMKQSIKQEAGGLLELRTDQPLLALDLLEAAGFDSVALFGKRIHLLAKDPDAARQKIDTTLASANIRLLGLSERPLGMEDVFVYRVLALEKQERMQQ